VENIAMCEKFKNVALKCKSASCPFVIPSAIQLAEADTKKLYTNKKSTKTVVKKATQETY